MPWPNSYYGDSRSTACHLGDLRMDILTDRTRVDLQSQKQQQSRHAHPEAMATPVSANARWSWRLRRLTDGPVGALIAAAFYGSWAAWVNAPAGAAVVLRVAATHAALSATLTFCGTAWMRRFFRAGRSRTDGAFYAFVGGLALTYSLLLGVHSLIGTPFIALTLVAGVVPNLLFCGAYALLLNRTGLSALHS